MKSHILLALLGISDATTIAEVSSPNPGDYSGTTAPNSDQYNCLQNGHVQCIHRLTAAVYCSDTSDTTYSADSDYKCSDKFTDKIYAHTLLSVAEDGDCPDNAMGEQSGAWGYINFPHGRQKCAVVIGSKCDAPSFRITTSSINKSDYEIYWAEWDLSTMDAQPSSTLTTLDSALTSDMNLVDAYPRLDEAFAYEGDGDDLTSGFPGKTGSYNCGWNFDCWLGYPKTTEQLDDLREKPYGLGQAATGQYNTDSGGYHYFGAQGQSDWGDVPFVPWISERCEDRQIVVVVVHKNTGTELFTTTTSFIQLEIRVAQAYKNAKYLKTLGLMSILATSYLQYLL